MKKTLLIKQNRQALLIWLIMAANPALAQVGSSTAAEEPIPPTTADSLRVAWTVDSLLTAPATLAYLTPTTPPNRLTGVAAVANPLRASGVASSEKPAGRKSTVPAKSEKTPRFWKLELAVGTDWQSLRSGRGQAQLAGRVMLDLPLVMNRARTYGVGVGVGSFVHWTAQRPGTNSFVLPYAALTWRQRLTSHLYAVARGGLSRLRVNQEYDAGGSIETYLANGRGHMFGGYLMFPFSRRNIGAGLMAGIDYHTNQYETSNGTIRPQRVTSFTLGLTL